jgi:hypothetical protein
LTVNQRVRVTLCTQVHCSEPVSISCATSGAPQNSPSRAGTISVISMIRPVASPLPLNRPPSPLVQLCAAVHATRSLCHIVARCRPVISAKTANAASRAALTAA